MPHKVDAARLTALVRRSLHAFAENGVSQARIERAIGLAHGYLSRINTGRSRPSQVLTLLLYVLARSPGRIERVERFWLTLPTETGQAPTEQS